MFFEASTNIAFAGCVDDNTPYNYSSNMQTVLSNLQEAIAKLFQRFSANYLVANADKYLFRYSAIDNHVSDATISN